MSQIQIKCRSEEFVSEVIIRKIIFISVCDVPLGILIAKNNLTILSLII